jgi:hypothetical protein
MSDEPIWEAARLNSLAQDAEHGGSMLEELWAKCPGIVDSLPFFDSKEKYDAAHAYLYAAKGWLSGAKAVLPKVTGLPDGAVEELIGNMARIEKNVAFLQALGYNESLDGVSSALANAARKIRENTPSAPTVAIGAGALIVILIALYIVSRKL